MTLDMASVTVIGELLQVFCVFALQPVTDREFSRQECCETYLLLGEDIARPVVLAGRGFPFSGKGGRSNG